VGHRHEVWRVRDHAVHQRRPGNLEVLQHVFGRPRVTLLWVAPAGPGAPLPTGIDLDLPGGVEQLAANALKARRQRRAPERVQLRQACPRAAHEVDPRSFILIGRVPHFFSFFATACTTPGASA